MKARLLFFALGLFSVISYAQAPQAIKYQAVVRDDAGDYIESQTVSLRISIHEGSAAGTIVYQETFSVMTSEFGLATLEIGNGTPVIGTFPGISWGSDDYFIETELDPDGGSTYTSMGTSQMLSVAYALHAETSGDSHWEIVGDDIYSGISGNIGIGTTTPSEKLHIVGKIEHEFVGTGNALHSSGSTTGSMWFIQNDNDGNGIGLNAGMTNANAGSTSMGVMGFNNGDGYGVYGINQNHLNFGLLGDNEYGVFGQNNNGHFGLLGGDTVGVYGQNSNGHLGVLGDEYFGVYGKNSNGNFGTLGDAYCGVYAENINGSWGCIGDAGFGTIGSNNVSNIGFLGTLNYGAYGADTWTGTYGFLGDDDYGAYGESGNHNYGVLGTDNYGVYGYINTQSTGDFAVCGHYVNDIVAGTDYDYNDVLGGVQGINHYGEPYTFGVAGHTWLMEDRAGAILGSDWQGIDWGSLAYQSSGGTEYGGYFTTYTAGSGKKENVQINNGIAAWGDLFGADIHGKVYGTYTEGNNFAIFSNGDNFTNGLDVHLQKNNKGVNKVLYTHVSTDATLQTSGYATLENGESIVDFDQIFADAVSSETPIIVTVTPIGNSNGVYLAEVTRTGFKVVENNGGKSNVNLNYIAIGKRVGYEDPQLPDEVLDADFTAKLERGLHNDGDTETDGEGLYYENGNLNVGIHPSTLLDQNNVDKEVQRVKQAKKLEIRPDIRKSEIKRPNIKQSEMKKPEIMIPEKIHPNRQAEDKIDGSIEKQAKKPIVNEARLNNASSENSTQNYKTYHGGPVKK